jgi:hypothetical protein
MPASLPAPERVALALLPCSRCSAPGPHARFIVHASGGVVAGYTALCGRCGESQPDEHSRQNGSDRLHGSPRIAGA